MIHQFTTPLAVHTPYGEGEAILLIDYSIDISTVWLIRLNDGSVVHCMSEDIRIYGNPMYGKEYAINIPDGWIK
jgi:hypothetical protein